MGYLVCVEVPAFVRTGISATKMARTTIPVQTLLFEKVKLRAGNLSTLIRVGEPSQALIERIEGGAEARVNDFDGSAAGRRPHGVAIAAWRQKTPWVALVDRLPPR
jgi:hypothetical protein